MEFVFTRFFWVILNLSIISFSWTESTQDFLRRLGNVNVYLMLKDLSVEKFSHFIITFSSNFHKWSERRVVRPPPELKAFRRFLRGPASTYGS